LLTPRVQEDRRRVARVRAPAAPDSHDEEPMTDAPAIVVGAGPAGLGAAASLTRRRGGRAVPEGGRARRPSGRNHYARRRRHTVKRPSSLPGLPFPAEVPRYPTREQVVDYL